MVTRKCRECWGYGQIDVSYHGSPEYEPCTRCMAKGTVQTEMTVEEKLNFLLDLINRSKANHELFPLVTLFPQKWSEP